MTLTLLILQAAERNYVGIKKIPDWAFEKLTQLRSLDISDCPQLRAVPPGLAALTQLRLLAIRRCSHRQLTRLPRTMSRLSKLTSLDLEGCSSLTKLPSAVGYFPRLKRLNLCDCSSLAFLPQSLHRLTSLTHLVLAGCTQLHSLPRHICTWKPLEARQPLQELSIPDEPVWLLAWAAWCIRCLPHCMWACLCACCHPGVSALLNKCCEWLRTGVRALARCLKECLCACKCCGLVVAVFRGLASGRSLELAVCSSFSGGLIGCLVWALRHGLRREAVKKLRWFVGIGVGLGLVYGLIVVAQEVIRARQGNRNRVPETCLVDTAGSGLPEAPSCHCREDVAEWKLGELMRTLEEQQQRSVLDVLVRDRAGRRAALEKLSIVGVLLANAALLSFRIAPATANELTRYVGGIAATPAPASGLVAAEAGRAWLTVFYSLQQVTFALSMALILYILVTAIPANSPVDILIVAGSAWVQFTTGCCLLVAALLSSIFAFFAGLIAVYTDDLLAEDEVQTVFKLTCLLVAGLVYAWGCALHRIWPGWAAIRAFGVYLVNMHVWGNQAVMRGPLRGTDEVVHSMHSVVQRVDAELRDMRSDLRQHASDQVELLKGMSSSRVECQASLAVPAEQSFVTARATVSGSAGGLLRREEGSAAQGSEGAAGPGVVSARNDGNGDDPPSGDGGGGGSGGDDGGAGPSGGCGDTGDSPTNGSKEFAAASTGRADAAAAESLHEIVPA